MSIQHARSRTAPASARCRNIRRIIATGTVVCALVLAGGVSAQATAPDTGDAPGSSPEEVRSQFTDEQLYFNPELTDAPSVASSDGSVTMRAAAFTITCTPTPEAPHISSTAGLGVIYKTRVSCTGTGDHPASATVRVRGGLFYDQANFDGDDANISWVQVKTSDESRAIAVGGAAATFYTPQVGTRGYTGKGHYQGTSTVQITNPPVGTVGAKTTDIYFRNPLGN